MTGERTLFESDEEISGPYLTKMYRKSEEKVQRIRIVASDLDSVTDDATFFVDGLIDFNAATSTVKDDVISVE